MIWLKIIEIVSRVLGALVLIGFSLGTLLHSKHEIFANILAGTAIVLWGYGFTTLLLYVIFGKIF